MNPDFSNASAPVASPALRELTTDELRDVNGGATYFDLNLFGYSLAIGDGGIMVCKPGSCTIVAWDALK